MSSAAQLKRKALGQHFLRDSNVCTKIVTQAFELAHSTESLGLLEIGPGKGALTELIFEELQKKESSHLIRFAIAEADPELVRHWDLRAQVWNESSKTGKTRAPIVIFPGDFMQVPDEKWSTPSPLTVVSNLPYSSGTAITTKLASPLLGDSVRAMVLMYQAEVAQRLRAEPKSKDWGSLSIWTQTFWDVSKLLVVPPKAFNPPPKVMSEVVVFLPRKEPRIAVAREASELALFEKLLKVSFAHRRKMLRAGLPKDGPWLKSLQAAGISEQLRAEALTWEQWSAWWNELKNG